MAVVHSCPSLFVISVTGSPEYHSLESFLGGGNRMSFKAMLAPVVAILLLAPAASAQGTYKRDLPDSLVAKAKVTEAAAAATAQKRFPNGAIQSVELEREDG